MPTRMALIRKTENIKSWEGCVGTGTFIYGWWGAECMTTLENNMAAYIGSKTHLPCDLAIILLNVYPKQTKIQLHKKMYTKMFIASVFTTASKQTGSSNWNPKGKCINKLWYIH